MMTTSQRELHDYISQISERADVRAGSPLPLGTQETGGGVNFAIFSRDAKRVRLELFNRPEDAVATRVIDLDASATAPATYGTSGSRGFVPVNSMPTAWMALTNPAKDIVSISTGFSSIPSPRRSRGCPLGISGRPADTIRRRRNKTWHVPRWTMPEPCRNACSLTSTSIGGATSHRSIHGRRL